MEHINVTFACIFVATTMSLSAGETRNISGVEALKQCDPRPLLVHRLQTASAGGLRPAYLWCSNSILFRFASYVGAFRLASDTSDSRYSLPNVRRMNAVMPGLVSPSSCHLHILSLPLLCALAVLNLLLELRL